ncbi:PepSY domain-containing protein [Roseovarius sp. D22-M7]|uniref:PepSY domain-containing protein n=1 Tax=Roseovarius sp. D22-M7 TaxID=3127116 RepID=UPI00300FDBA9
MTRITPLALAITLSLGGIAQASDDQTVEKAKAEEIKATLSEQGYDVRRVKTEDGLFEAYALKDGQRYEIYLDESLEVVKTERDA